MVVQYTTIMADGTETCLKHRKYDSLIYHDSPTENRPVKSNKHETDVPKHVLALELLRLSSSYISSKL